MMVTETGEDEAAEMKESLSADLIKDLFCFEEQTACATHEMIECQRCCVDGKGTGHVPQHSEVNEDDLHTWSHHTAVTNVGDPILEQAHASILASKDTGLGSAGAGVTFTMGCHIE